MLDEARSYKRRLLTIYWFSIVANGNEGAQLALRHQQMASIFLVQLMQKDISSDYPCTWIT